MGVEQVVSVIARPARPIAAVAEGTGDGPWNPGIRSRLPAVLLPLATIFRPENVSTSIETGSATSTTISCAGGAPIDPIEETVTSGASGLQYDVATQTYTYVWKTQKAWSGTCRRFTLELDDGTLRTADFQFR